MSPLSTSYRWAGVTQENVAGLVNHDARDVDLANGRKVEHSNPDINAAMTHLNQTMVNDGSGNMVPCKSSKEWTSFIDDRVAQATNSRKLKDGRIVPVAIRKDAAVVIEFIGMLDPKSTGKCADMTPEQRVEVQRLLQVMVDEMVERMRPENVAGYTFHWDETHPHVQLMAVPMTEDGQLSMRKVFKGTSGVSAKKHYSEMHDSMRIRLQEAGYDATMERVDGGRPHRKLKQFKEFKDREAAVDIKEAMAKQTEAHTAKWAESLEAKESEIRSREAEAAHRASEAARRTEAAERALEGVRARERRLREREAELEAKLAEADSVKAAFSEGLEKASVLGSAADDLVKSLSGVKLPIAAKPGYDSWAKAKAELAAAVARIDENTPEDSEAEIG